VAGNNNEVLESLLGYVLYYSCAKVRNTSNYHNDVKPIQKTDLHYFQDSLINRQFKRTTFEIEIFCKTVTFDQLNVSLLECLFIFYFF